MLEFTFAVEAASPAAGSVTPPQRQRTRSINLGLLTPQSTSSSRHRVVLTPRTPDPIRNDLKLLRDRVSVIFFDFDGTLTATPGNLVVRQSQKAAELLERASLIAPHLTALRNAGILLGIISKSTENTVRTALQAAGLSEFFTGPVVGKAVGLEGKVGFIEELAASGTLGASTKLQHVLLVDDDVRELDRARMKGVQTWPAPAEGGLQTEDFDAIFTCLGVPGTQAPVHLAECCSPKGSFMGYPAPPLAHITKASANYGVSNVGT